MSKFVSNLKSKMDTLSLIKQPIETELGDFIDLFNHALDHEDGLLRTVLNHIKQRAGKRMRPILILLMAKNFGKVSEATQHAAVGLSLYIRLHLFMTMSLMRRLLAEDRRV